MKKEEELLKWLEEEQEKALQKFQNHQEEKEVYGVLISSVYANSIAIIIRKTKEIFNNADSDNKSELLSIVIEDLDFSVSIRAYNLLKANGVKTIGDIVNCTKQDLFRFVGIGRKTVRDIEDILFEKGLSLKQN